MTAVNLKIGLCLLTLLVIVFGAYVRLTDAGLGCPDWPGCYGKLILNFGDADEISDSSFDAGKAWREMIHRYLAGLLGVGILGIALYSLRLNSVRGMLSLDVLLVPLVVFQSVLGMFTVTLLLKPLIVTAHLMGGLTILSILWWSVLEGSIKSRSVGTPKSLQILGFLVLFTLAIQIFLGGWTSTNYAALACTDFPKCQGTLVPPLYLREAFTFWRGVGIDYEHGVLDSGARTTIHFVHRLWALVSALIVLLLVVVSFARGRREVKWVAALMAFILFIQITLGISNIMLGLPLVVAVAHNGVAGLLLLTIITYLFLTVRGGSFQNGIR